VRLFHSLNGNGESPYEWVVSRICEEFNVLPTQALEELDNDPERLVYRIMTLRAFANTKQQLDDAKKISDVPYSSMRDTVLQIDMEEAKKEIDKKKG
jgi:hypothetical protein